jgi:hypothetical protein
LVEILGVLSNPVFAAIITGSIGIFGTYLAAIQKFRKDLEAEFDKELRKERVEAYKDLWNDLRKLSHTHKNPLTNVTYGDLTEIMWKMHDRYFESGIYLSSSSRFRFFELKDCIYDNLTQIDVDIKEIIVEKERSSKDKSKDMNLEDKLDSPLSWIFMIRSYVKVTTCAQVWLMI